MLHFNSNTNILADSLPLTWKEPGDQRTDYDWEFQGAFTLSD